jgi:hypothetical protein
MPTRPMLNPVRIETIQRSPSLQARVVCISFGRSSPGQEGGKERGRGKGFRTYELQGADHVEAG